MERDSRLHISIVPGPNTQYEYSIGARDGHAACLRHCFRNRNFLRRLVQSSYEYPASPVAGWCDNKCGDSNGRISCKPYYVIACRNTKSDYLMRFLAKFTYMIKTLSTICGVGICLCPVSISVYCFSIPPYALLCGFLLPYIGLYCWVVPD